MTAFELAVQDLTGIRVAGAVGADRIELCTALSTGGLTPSRGLIEAAADAGPPVHVLIRPRAGGFDYAAEEHRLIVADARAAMAAGASGVVVGGTRGGVVDTDLVRAVQDVAPEVTFHRAFDVLVDLDRALDAVLELGVRRVLTSGGAARAVDALDVLTRLVRRADGALEVMAGAGISAVNVVQVAATGVDAVHASAKRRVDDALALALGSDGGNGYETTDERAAGEILAALRGGEA
ncbi:copper homeostasis protein CutC [Ruania alba]|uniref:PF03932 family protein CutC n=1 Tax=Ruania alba TaxID=648782 RepID=A0A1H5MWR0_9MICO|nr:copper homeostasis protein CutC [Ruania alba]SEE93716.1 copper homeostasis protein [Ruania alba]